MKTTTAQKIATALDFNFLIHTCDSRGEDSATKEEIIAVIDKALSEDAEQGEQSSSVEMDGCPTEGAVLKREWRAMYELLKMFRGACRKHQFPNIPIQEPFQLTNEFLNLVEARTDIEEDYAGKTKASLKGEWRTPSMTYAEATKTLSTDEKKDLCITKLIDTLCELMPIITKFGDPTTSAAIGGVLHTLDGLMQGVYEPSKSPFNKPTA